MALTQPGVRESSQDVVAILNSADFQPLFAGAHIMRATVRESSKITNFAVEDGTQRTDHRYLEPIEIDLPILLTDDTRNLYEQLRQAFIDGVELTIQTRVRSYPSMMLMEMPHDETPEQGESIPVAIKLKEIRTVKPEFGTLPPSKVRNAKQSSTAKKGNQQTTDADGAKQRKASVLYEVFN